MEASALHQSGLSASAGRSPLLRLRSDEQLIALTRRGNQSAFETLVQRYQSRLLAFCRHMLSSKEDAEDVLQEVFAASYNALMADERPINTRPWLYRIARNRCLNHLRKPRPAGQDSMDIFERDNGTSTADTVHRREEFRQIVADVGLLPESQRSALLLREIDALSYEQIAEAMDTTVPSVKSLLVRARVSLAEAAEARLLTCAEVRLELGQVAEGLAKTTPPVRRHLKGCRQCRVFRGELRHTTKALAAIAPVGPLLLILNKVGLTKLGFGGLGGAAAGGAASTAGAGSIAGGAGVAAGGAVAAGSGAAAAGGALSAIGGGIAGKAAAGMAAAAIVTAGAVEVKHVTKPSAPVTAQVQQQPISVHPAPPAAAVRTKPARKPVKKAAAPAKPDSAPKPEPVAAAAPAVEPTPAPVAAPVPAPPAVQEEEGTVTLPTDEATAPPATTTPAAPPKPPPAATTPAPTPPKPPPAGTTPTPPPPPPPPVSGGAPAPAPTPPPTTGTTTPPPLPPPPPAS
ncbi:MAG TPA: RNA polymerase sigma factor [Thermoleophilaceae bacterium]|nr:RNA polymerase sigma factor [Thermoleophilaceae bacterium]